MQCYFSLISGCFVNNRQVKGRIIDLVEDSICFSYPRDRKKSQMFFLSKIKPINIAIILRKADPLKECPNVLWAESKEFDFCLEVSTQLKMQLLVWNTISEIVHQIGVHSLVPCFHINPNQKILCENVIQYSKLFTT